MRTGLMGGLALVAVVVASPTARAGDLSLGIGLKWTPLTYTKPITAVSGPKQADLGSGSWQQTSLDSYFGAYFLGGRLGTQIGFDFGYASVKNEVTSGAAGSSGEDTFTQFGFSLGAKWYILQPRKEHVSPYVFVDFFKYFASISSSDSMVTNDQAGFIAGLASPLGIDFAAGAEYFFTPAFSFGAEVVGLRYSYSEGDYSTPGGFGGSMHFSQTRNLFTLYTGISLNYRFQVIGEPEPRPPAAEEAAPRRRRVAQPPPEPESEEPDESEESPSPPAPAPPAAPAPGPPPAAPAPPAMPAPPAAPAPPAPPAPPQPPANSED
jgi:hypothetical protein